MSTPKGWGTQEKDERLVAQFATVEPVRERQQALSVLSHEFVELIGTDAAEAGSNAYSIVATAHAARKGDVIRLTSGTYSGTDLKVDAVTANLITLSETLDSSIAVAVTFQILRHRYPTVASDGSINATTSLAPAAIKFVKDSVLVSVNEDTGTPANNVPLPVKITSATGPINITAGDLGVHMQHDGADPASTRVGDGTDLLSITASGQAEVAVTAALPAGTNTIGSAKITDGTDTLSVTASGQAEVAVTAALPVGANTIGNVNAIQSGTWNVNNVSGTVSLPTGASTSALQTTGNTSLSSIDGKLNSLGQKASAASAPVVIASDQSAIPASQSGTWNINNVSGTVSLPTGASTAANQATGNASLASIDAGIPAALGSTTSANSMPVVIASDQGAVPVSQSGTWNVTNVSGTVSLPTGAATSALQTTGNTSLASIDAGIPAALGSATSANSMPVVIASDQGAVPVSQSGTWNVNNISGTVSLPTGAATAANQTTANTSLSSIDAGIPAALGSTTSANAMPVVLASDQAGIKGFLGRTVVTTVRNDYSSTNVTTGAWVQLVASTASIIHEFDIFDSSGQTLELGTGAAASETRLILIFPGGNGRVPVTINAATRVSIRAVSATASSGELDINFYDT